MTSMPRLGSSLKLDNGIFNCAWQPAMKMSAESPSSRGANNSRTSAMCDSWEIHSSFVLPSGRMSRTLRWPTEQLMDVTADVARVASVKIGGGDSDNCWAMATIRAGFPPSARSLGCPAKAKKSAGARGQRSEISCCAGTGTGRPASPISSKVKSGRPVRRSSSCAWATGFSGPSGKRIGFKPAAIATGPVSAPGPDDAASKWTSFVAWRRACTCGQASAASVSTRSSTRCRGISCSRTWRSSRPAMHASLWLIQRTS
mmetsp:Transcript_1136/g.2128  ORF Transcript_1136/g.2128 Transcript_1136/m.2128 type:complete len:258 (-) Transcript_1136:22-795(-)